LLSDHENFVIGRYNLFDNDVPIFLKNKIDTIPLLVLINEHNNYFIFKGNFTRVDINHWIHSVSDLKKEIVGVNADILNLYQ
jgi:hypothetical protein